MRDAGRRERSYNLGSPGSLLFSAVISCALPSCAGHSAAHHSLSSGRDPVADVLPRSRTPDIQGNWAHGTASFDPASGKLSYVSGNRHAFVSLLFPNSVNMEDTIDVIFSPRRTLIVLRDYVAVLPGADDILRSSTTPGIFGGYHPENGRIIEASLNSFLCMSTGRNNISSQKYLHGIYSEGTDHLFVLTRQGFVWMIDVSGSYNARIRSFDAFGRETSYGRLYLYREIVVAADLDGVVLVDWKPPYDHTISYSLSADRGARICFLEEDGSLVIVLGDQSVYAEVPNEGSLAGALLW